MAGNKCTVIIRRRGRVVIVLFVVEMKLWKLVIVGQCVNIIHRDERESASWCLFFCLCGEALFSLYARQDYNLIGIPDVWMKKKSVSQTTRRPLVVN